MFKSFYYTINALLIFVFHLSSQTPVFPPGFSELNFECGGYVTEIIPTIEPGHLYARTDIGGVYKSKDNGNSWAFISWDNTPGNNNFTTPLSLMVQGLAVHPGNPNIVVIGCGSSLDPPPPDPGKGVYVTFDGGVSWTHVINFINFSGNGTQDDDFNKKIGGECILFNPLDTNYVYFGGRGSGLWVLNLSTMQYQQVASNISGNISTIAMNINFPNEIWVGSDAGIWKSEDYGGSFNQLTNIDVRSAVYRIVFTDDYNVYVTFCRYADGDLIWGFWYSYDGGANWTNLSGNFDPSGISSNVMVALKPFNMTANDEYDLLAGRMISPTKVSHISGGQFSEWNTLDLPVNISTLPSHFLFNGYDNYIFGSRNNFSVGPNGTDFYCSGGAAPLRSNNLYGEWEYITNGINMPVVYDVNIELSPSLSDFIVYIPISDWTAVRTTYVSSQNFNKLNYLRTRTKPGDDSDTYISNVTRVLRSQTSVYTYLIGGSVYDPFRGAICRSSDIGMTYERMFDWSTGHPFSQPDRALIDGIISSGSGMAEPIDTLVVILARSQFESQPDDPLGIYYSFDNGNNFQRAGFNGLDGRDYVSEYEFQNSILGLSDNGTQFESLFSKHFGLANGWDTQTYPDSNYKFLYLAGYNAGSEMRGGGFFCSANGGANWRWISHVVGDNIYRDRGCICTGLYPRLLIGVRNTEIDSFHHGGLYYSDDPVNEINPTWNKYPSFKSVEQVDALETPTGNQLIVVFGKMTSDSFNKIYASNNGGFSWFEITDLAHKLPTTRSLTINPMEPNEVWIGTGGQGVFVYSGLISGDSGPFNLSLNEMQNPYKYNLSQNYPNPFNPKTTINYSVAKDIKVNISIYDVLGREVKVLVNEFKPAGNYSIEFDGSNLASGIYFYRIVAGNYISVKKMVFLK